jgi:hypothetical protein
MNLLVNIYSNGFFLKKGLADQLRNDSQNRTLEQQRENWKYLQSYTG